MSHKNEILTTVKAIDVPKKRMINVYFDVKWTTVYKANFNNVKISHSSIGKDDIIGHLTDVLEKRSFSSTSCSVCDWIDSVDDKWHKCASCEETICGECGVENYCCDL